MIRWKHNKRLTPILLQCDTDILKWKELCGDYEIRLKVLEYKEELEWTE